MSPVSEWRNVDNFPKNFDNIPELTKEERLHLAHQAACEAGENNSLSEIARKFGVAYATLWARKNQGAVSRKEDAAKRQKLSVGEEDALRDWIILLTSWGWPARN